jgi:hypothetical protein
MISNANLSRATLGLAAAETLFWLYTFSYINSRANPMGDGMEWLAAVPMTIISLALVLPALILGVVGWWFTLAAQIGAALAALAALADVIVWAQILGEFAHKTAH